MSSRTPACMGRGSKPSRVLMEAFESLSYFRLGLLLPTRMSIKGRGRSDYESGVWTPGPNSWAPTCQVPPFAQIKRHGEG
jgi:hypothetical protein